jgi:hypothetical protein
METEQDEVVKITLEVVDKFSKPLDNLVRELAKIDDKTSDSGSKGKKAFDGMRDSVNGVAGAFKMLTPALSGSLAGFTSLAAAVGTLASALHKFADNTETLQRLSHETGISANRMRELEAVYRRFGVTAGEMRAGMRGIADAMHDVRRGGPIFQELARSGLPNFANQLRGAKDNAQALELIIKELDRIKDPFERRRFLGIVGGPEGLATATGAQREKLLQEYRKTNPPPDKDTLERVERYNDALWKSGNAVDAIIQKDAKDLDTLATQLDLMAKGTLAASGALGDFNKVMEDVRKNGEQSGEAMRRRLPKSPGRPLTWWEMLFGLKPENQSLEGSGGGKGKDVIKSATSEGVVDGFLKFAMLVGNRDGGGGARVIRASLGGNDGYGGNRTRSSVAPPPEESPRPPRTASRPPPGDPGASSPRSPSSTGPMGDGADPNQSNRPYHIGGKVTMDGKTYTWGSGGAGRGSLPYGDFPINIGRGDIGSIGKRIGSVATVGGLGGVIKDPKFPGHPRGGIQIHSGSGSTLDHLYSQGCFAVSRAQWPAFKKALLEKAQHGQLMLHIGRDGLATITTRGERERPELANPPKPPEAPRNRLRDAQAQPGTIKGDATVRIDVNGLPRGSRMAASSSGVFSSVELHRGNTLPLASESA